MLASYQKDRTKTDMEKRRIDFKLTEAEFEIVELYCKKMGLSKTAVLRALIRQLGEDVVTKSGEAKQNN